MTSFSMLAVLERKHVGTPAADCISARIGELKAAQAAAAKAAEQRSKAEAAAKRRAEEEARAEERAKADAAARKRADDQARANAETERQRLVLLQQEEEGRAEAKRKDEEEAARVLRPVTEDEIRAMVANSEAASRQAREKEKGTWVELGCKQLGRIATPFRLIARVELRRFACMYAVRTSKCGT